MYHNKFKRYKNHYVCLECRKGFIKPNEKDIAEKEGDLSLLLNAFYYSKPKKTLTKDQKEALAEKYLDS